MDILMDDVFALAASQMQPASQPHQQQQQAPQQIAPASGDVFGQAAAEMQGREQQTQHTPVPSALDIDGTPNPLLKAAKGVNAIGAGIGEGVLDTLNGGASMMHLPHATLEQRSQQLQQQNAGNPVLNTVGKSAEGLAEFFTGDEALKGLTLSERLAKATKLAKLLEDSPRLKRAFDIGSTALRQGTVAGTLGTVTSGGNAKEGATEGAIAAGLSGAFGIGGATLNAIRGATDIQSIQKPLQTAIRAIVTDAAKDEGVSPVSRFSHLSGDLLHGWDPTASEWVPVSIRDMAHEASDAVEAKAKSLYQTLDQVSGGRAQRFRDALRNVNQSLGNIVGLDDDEEARLAAKKADIEAGHQKMLADLQAAGHDPNLLAKAGAAWKKQSALADLGNAIRQSTTGMRPELATVASSTPESINPKTLFTKLNRLYDSGRLQDAIGQENAANLLRHVDSAFVQSQRIVDNSRWSAALKKTALGAAGLAAAGTVASGARHFAHELLGGAE